MNEAANGLTHELSPSKRALLNQLLQGQSVRGASERIPRRAGDGPHPLSFAQQRLWFLDKLVPDSPMYNVYTVITLQGWIDPAALQRSLDEIVRRHAILRTRFVELDGRPLQVVGAEVPLPLRRIDLGELAPEQRAAQVQRYAADEARRPFRLDQAPLLRCTLLAQSESQHVLILCMHHIVTDGWSLDVLSGELSALYDAFVRGQASPLPELPIQYADFALWQRERLAGEVRRRELAYWQAQLEGLPVLALPTDRPRGPVQTFRGAWLSIEMPESLNLAVRTFSRTEGVTPFMTLLAAFKALLHHYTGQDDVVVGSPIAGRNRTELEGLIGFFVNTLVLRTRFDRRLPFRELVRQVQRTALDAFSHQELPFGTLVEELHPDRDLSRNPMFQVMFQLLNGPRSAAPRQDGEPPPMTPGNQTSKFDLTVTLVDTGHELAGSLEYNTDLFDATTVAGLLQHLRTLLEAALTAPGTPVQDLPLLSAVDRRRWLQQAQATARPYPRDSALAVLFEARAAAAPQAIAVAVGDAVLGYGMLNARANRLARHLRAEGLKPGGRVGLLMDRSVEMVIATLAVLKAGGCYVPLDPSHPPSRLDWICSDAGVVRLLLGPGQEPAADIAAGVPRCTVDDPALAGRAETNLDLPLPALATAYVMYTSGSTGTPKGIAIPQRAVVRLVLGTDYVALDAGDRVAHASNCAFDAATFEIWGALLNGATLVPIDAATVMSPEALAACLERERITTLFITTALFNQMVQQVPTAFHKLRQLLFGGEAVDVRRVHELLAAGPPARLLHVYGPTENTTFSSWHEVAALDDHAATVPIGHALANTRLYVLDARLRPVPTGVAGELCIAGDGLAHGYLGRPELTAARFVPDPHAPTPGARMYRSGDRVRQRADGAIEFLGRNDHQVKLRGFRVELGEIEAALAAHADIAQAAVAVHDDPVAGRQLVAWVAPGPARHPDAPGLRRHLRERLPGYMMPARIHVLASLPLNANGKIDRAALLEPADGDNASAALQPPETSMQRRVAEIWQDVLQREAVGIHDNFFDLGGHSLLMARVHAGLLEALARPVSMIDLFRYPTVSELAHHLDAAPVATGEPASIVPAERDARDERVRDRVALQRAALARAARRKE